MIWIINTGITIWYCLYHYSDLNGLNNLFALFYNYLYFILKIYIRALLIMYKILVIGYANDIGSLINSDINYTMSSIL